MKSISKNEIEILMSMAIEQTIELHKSLHGIHNINAEDISRDVIIRFAWDYDEILNITKKVLSKTYGLFIGRCQPFTNGHNSVIQEIIRDGREPIIILGSIDVIDERNPLSYNERKELILKIYPNITVIGVSDSENWETWFASIERSILHLGIEKNNITLYSHAKPGDLFDFEFRDKEYFNEPYTIVFRDNGFNIKHLEEYCCSLGLTVHASDIRKDEEIAKRNLDSRIYVDLKKKDFWSDE